jgi:hypothetical protein
MKGIVEHVTDGSLMVFEAPNQLLAFMRQAVFGVTDTRFAG